MWPGLQGKPRARTGKKALLAAAWAAHAGRGRIWLALLSALCAVNSAEWSFSGRDGQGKPIAFSKLDLCRSPITWELKCDGILAAKDVTATGIFLIQATGHTETSIFPEEEHGTTPFPTVADLPLTNQLRLQGRLYRRGQRAGRRGW